MKYFDYSRGLKAPYSIQVIKSPSGYILWVFAQPLSLSYILMLLVGIFFTAIFWKFFPIPTLLGVNFNFLLMLYIPNKIARWYSETEFDGKTGLSYIKDFLFYMRDFVFDSRAIVGFERVRDFEDFSFER